MNQSPLRTHWLTLLLGLVFVGALMVSLSASDHSIVFNGSTKVQLDNAHAGGDQTGGFSQSTVTNYDFLVNQYGGYTYADTVQKYLSAYLRIAHVEPYKSIKIQESSFKQVDDTVSTFMVEYGDKTLEARVTQDQGAATMQVEVTSDNGQAATYSTGVLNLDVVN